MTISPPVPPLTPSVDDFTHNGATSGNVVGSFDLLCLPGMVVSFLDDDTFTCSSGVSWSVLMLYVDESVPVTEPANLSMGSTDSSSLTSGTMDDSSPGGDCASMFKLPRCEADCLNFAALLLLFGGFVALLLETAAQGLQQTELPQEPPS